MNIYELEKQATPGPWPLDVVPLDTLTMVPLPNVEMDGTFSTTEKIANWMLAAHCRNHFMEALKALKALTISARTFRNVPLDEKQWTSYDDAALDNAFDVIARMEEVGD